MSFLYPLGLLGLIGVPVIIIIYIIKNKYTEQVIPSTYLWTLSERFLKRKNPLDRLTGIISLILQLLTVIFVSFAIARPMIFIPDAAGSYCYVLDCSGSMQMEKDGVTRFEQGKERIRTLIEGTMDGSEYTLVLAGETSDVIYEKLADKERALSLLNDVTPSCLVADMVKANEKAQAYFNENPATQILLITDKGYDSTKNITVENVAAKEENYAVTDVTYFYEGGVLVVSGNVYSYESAAQVTVELYAGNEETPVSSQKISLNKAMEGETFRLESTANTFPLRVAIKEEDCLALDNQVVIYNVKMENTYSTLIVSDKPFFFQQAFTANGYGNVEIIAPEKYSDQSGYGLYVFDSFVPAAIPSDGAVWFINPTGNIAGSGFIVQDHMSDEEVVTAEYSTSTASAVRNLLKNTLGSPVDIKDYAQCQTYRNFTTLLTYENYPMIFAGSNDFGNREVVFAFDLHVPFVLTMDYMVLMDNLLDYTFPEVIEKTSFYCGETMSVNVLGGCTGIRVDAPDGKFVYLETAATTAEYVLEQQGTYTVWLTMGNNKTRSFNVFAALPEEERLTTVANEESFALIGEASGERLPGNFDPLLILVVAVALIYLADWGVYCYEQYQLR